jgi:opacity protein-like surface antigen
MGFISRSTIAGAALLLCGVTNAHADGMAPRGGGYQPVAVAAPSFYLRGDYSHAWQDAGELWGATTHFSNSSVDDTWALGIGIGRYFGRGIRGDLTYEWRGETDVTGSTTITGCGGGQCTTSFGIKSQVLLANLYYDFRPGERFTPYIGVGLGVVRHDVSGGEIVCGAVCTFGGDKDWNAAGALMAGFSYRIDRGAHTRVSIKDAGFDAPAPGRLHLDVGYRYLYLGEVHTGDRIGVVPATPGPRIEDLSAHEIRVGVRWDLR